MGKPKIIITLTLIISLLKQDKFIIKMLHLSQLFKHKDKEYIIPLQILLIKTFQEFITKTLIKVKTK